MKRVIISLLTTGALLNVNAFSIRTNPPISMFGFTCQCTTSLCDCRQGNASISVVPEVDYYKHITPDRDIFGNKMCAETCLLKIAKVVSISYPSIQVIQLREAEKNISQSVRNNMTTQQRMSLIVSSLKEKAADIPFIGKFLQDDEDKIGDITTEKLMSFVKEKAVSATEKKAQQMNVDMSGYIVMRTAKLWFRSSDDLSIGLLKPVMLTINRLNEIQLQNKMMKFYEYFLLIDNFPEIAEVLPFAIYASNEDKVQFLYKQKKCIRSLLYGKACEDQDVSLLLSEIMSGRNPIFFSKEKDTELDKDILLKQLEKIDKVLQKDEIKKVLGAGDGKKARIRYDARYL